VPTPSGLQTVRKIRHVERAKTTFMFKFSRQNYRATIMTIILNSTENPPRGTSKDDFHVQIFPPKLQGYDYDDHFKQYGKSATWNEQRRLSCSNFPAKITGRQL
jgi:hypothetical protein